MVTLTLTEEQVMELVRQLPADRQEALLQYLLLNRWPTWVGLSDDIRESVRSAARQRGRDWDSMTEDQREEFVDDLLHED